ncbi:MAG: hypothetical protein F6K26_29600 [Moorea sp. SIO2I5]|nr:hypothetical protein [Moorena sp. SIO2I5]
MSLLPFPITHALPPFFRPGLFHSNKTQSLDHQPSAVSRQLLAHATRTA